MDTNADADLDWIKDKRKRLRQDHNDAQLAKQEEHAGRLREHAMVEEVGRQTLRQGYPHYAEDMERIKRCVLETLKAVDWNEICWVEFKDERVTVSRFGPMPDMPEWRKAAGVTIGLHEVNFHSPSTLVWTSLPYEENSSSAYGFSMVCAHDLAEWTKTIGLQACQTQPLGAGTSNTTMPVPFATRCDIGPYRLDDQGIEYVKPQWGNCAVGVRIPIDDDE